MMLGAAAAILAIVAADPDVTVKTIGSLRIEVDSRHARPGGLFVVHIARRTALGASFAQLDGRKVPVFQGARGSRALVPIPADAPPGPRTLGIEIWGRRGRSRLGVAVTIGAREYPPRSVVLPESKRQLLRDPKAMADGRRLLEALRTSNPAPARTEPLTPPVSGVPMWSFGAPHRYQDAPEVESRMDGLSGEFHRGLDFDVPPGSPVSAPAAARVVLARGLVLSGETVVLDHGQGLVSALFHLSRIDVVEGQELSAGAPVGLSGDTGVAETPRLHWGVYLHGVAIDPRDILGIP
jgi:murein DD-endopeptidase MepM/ murein hydrolase activator NlpD